MAGGMGTISLQNKMHSNFRKSWQAENSIKKTNGCLRPSLMELTAQ